MVPIWQTFLFHAHLNRRTIIIPARGVGTIPLSTLRGEIPNEGETILFDARINITVGTVVGLGTL